MSDFDDDERSVSLNRPIDLYTIATTSGVYHLTSHIVDVAFAGRTFTALTMSRGDLQIGQDLTGRELIVYLPISHPLVQRYAATGVPEQSVLVTLQRLQERSGAVYGQWQGFGQSMTFDARVARLRVPSVTDDAMRVRLPVMAVQQHCNYVLFDAQCSHRGPNDTSGGEVGGGTLPGPVRADFQIAVTLASVSANGLTITLVDAGGKPDAWATFGRVIMAGGETRRVLSHVGPVLNIDVPFALGDISTAIVVEAGCDHIVGTCRDKFSNVVNFGGHPYINSSINPWAPAGLGVLQQS